MTAKELRKLSRLELLELLLESAKENEKLKERMKETANNYEQISEAYYRLSEGINNAIEEFKTRYPKNAYGEPELGGIACEFSLVTVLEIIKKNIGE